jgi:hypothetical protein
MRKHFATEPHIKRPLSFEANQGQSDSQTKFLFPGTSPFILLDWNHLLLPRHF